MRAVKRGKRYFAVPKQLGLADRIAARSDVRGNWANVMASQPGARVIVNAKRQ